MNHQDQPQDYQTFLDQHPEVEQVQLLLSDPNGTLRGKSAPVHELKGLYGGSMAMPSSTMAMSIRGEDVSETGIVWETGDADGPIRPIAGTLRLCPWRKRPTAQVMIELDPDSHPTGDLSPRHTLRKMMDLLAKDGLTPVMATEVEFYLMDAAAVAAGDMRPLASNAPHSDPAQCYSIDAVEKLEDFFDDFYAACAAQKLPAETILSEYAPGQFEINLLHQANPLQVADETVMLKRLLRGIAGKHGLIANFMAKPYAELAGNGMHVHMSVLDKDGNNIFESDNPFGTEAMAKVVGGMQTLANDFMLLMAPHANSARRFRSGSYAPTLLHWGVNNRTTAFRIPASAPAARRVEHRIAGGDCNPYWVLSAILASVHYGLHNNCSPTEPIEGNGYEQEGLEVKTNWQTLIQSFGESQHVKNYFGERTQRVYTAIKKAEYEAFESQVPAEDFAWYLHTV